jgi:hypothetical protein
MLRLYKIVPSYLFIVAKEEREDESISGPEADA